MKVKHEIVHHNVGSLKLSVLIGSSPGEEEWDDTYLYGDSEIEPPIFDLISEVEVCSASRKLERVKDGMDSLVTLNGIHIPKGQVKAIKVLKSERKIHTYLKTTITSFLIFEKVCYKRIGVDKEGFPSLQEDQI